MNTLNRMARGFVFHVMLELRDGSEWLVTFTVHSVLWISMILTVLGMFSMCVIWSILLTRRGQLRLGSSLGSRSASGSVVSGIHTPEEEACRTVLCQKPYANLCCLFGKHRIDEWWDDADKQLFLCNLLRINLFSEGIIGWAVWRSLKWATGWGRAGFHQIRLTNGTLFIFFWYFSPKPLSCEGASRMFAHGKS